MCSCVCGCVCSVLCYFVTLRSACSLPRSTYLLLFCSKNTVLYILRTTCSTGLLIIQYLPFVQIFISPHCSVNTVPDPLPDPRTGQSYPTSTVNWDNCSTWLKILHSITTLWGQGKLSIETPFPSLGL